MNRDLIVVGAGPAGINAAKVAATYGMSVTVLDENLFPGGRLLGQLHQKPNAKGSDRWWNGLEIAAKRIEEAKRVGVEFVCGSEVWGVFPGWTVMVQSLQGGQTYEAPRVLLATGAAEDPIPVPGWELPGVMSIGASQVLVNVHRVRPGKRVIIIGINILSLTIARELTLAGVEVAAMVLPPPSETSGERANFRVVLNQLLKVSHLAPSPFIKFVGPRIASTKLVEKVARFYPLSGMRVWGIPIQLRMAALEIKGGDSVEGIVVAPVDGSGHLNTVRAREVPVDVVCIAGGLYPLAELAATVGCQFAHVPELGGHVPLYGPNFETTAPGVYVSGNITGIEGAEIAMAQGLAAGYAICRDAGFMKKEEGDVKLAQACEEIRRVRQNADIQFLERIQEGKAQLARLWESYANNPR